MRWSAIAFAALGIAMPAVARADVGVVVVTSSGASDDDAAVASAMRAALERRGEVVRADVDAAARAALSDGAVPMAALAGFEQVRALVEEGWAAYLQVQRDTALARLGEARAAAEALAPLDGGLEAYADVALRLGAALDNAGQTAEAEDWLRLAGTLDPDRPVTLQQFSPDVVAAYDRARAATRARRVLRVVAEGMVEIDGGPAAKAPVEQEVDVGSHVVVVRAPGKASRAQTVSVAAGEGAAEIAVTLEADAAALALLDRPVRGQSGAATAAWLEAVSIYAELDAVVLVSAIGKGGRPALIAQWCEAESCTPIVELGYDRGDLAAASRGVVDELRDARGGERTAPSLPSDRRIDGAGPQIISHRCRWCRPALYAGAGLAVAVAATIAIAVAVSGDDRTIVGLDADDFLTGD